MQLVKASLHLRRAQVLLHRRVVWMKQRQIAYDLRYSQPDKYGRLKEAIDRFNFGKIDLWEIRADVLPPLFRMLLQAAATIARTVEIDEHRNTEIIIALTDIPIFPPGTRNIRVIPQRPGAPTHFPFCPR